MHLIVMSDKHATLSATTNHLQLPVILLIILLHAGYGNYGIIYIYIHIIYILYYLYYLITRIPQALTKSVLASSLGQRLVLLSLRRLRQPNISHVSTCSL